MIRILKYGEVSNEEIFDRSMPTVNVADTVAEILRNVRERGDEALREYTEKFDKARPESLVVTPEEMEEALRQTEPEFLAILEKAAANIRKFHSRQVRNSFIINDEPGIVMEGGSIDVNGVGDLLTTSSCLLNPNRNPQLNRDQIEDYLRGYYGVDNIIWLGDGIVGDDTDGHVDDLSRFVNEDTIITAVEEDSWDENYEALQRNLKALNSCRLANGKQPTVVELPMPDMVFYDNQRLPASYANFYIANNKVIFPTYRCLTDNEAAYTLEACFPDREIVGIDDTTANTLFEVSRTGASPSDHPVLIPVAEEFIKGVDNENREIRVTLPKGLLEL